MAAETWRERDLRGSHGPPPRSVAQVVRRVASALAWARRAESVLLGAAAFALTQAALAVGGGDTGDPQAVLLALLMALLGGASWGRVHRADERSVARALDRRLRHAGGLLTAYECEHVPAPGPLTPLLVERVLRRLRLAEALRAMLPPLFVPLAAPLVALGLLVLALDARREARADRMAVAELPGIVAGMRGALDALEDAVLEASEAGTLHAGAMGELLGAVNRGRSIERRRDALAVDEAGRAAGRAELERLQRDLAAQLPRVAADPALRRALERAGNWVDAARGALGGDPGRPAGGAAAGAGAPDATVTPDGAEGTMPAEASGTTPGPTPVAPAPSAAEGSPPEEPAAVPVAPEAGTLAGDEWPRAYDGIVSGWIERTRRRKEAPPR